MPTLHTVICSTREGRAGLPIGEWFFNHATAHGVFATELIDLKTVNLPLLDEPHHPRLHNYEYAHTKAWSAIVERADAFVFVVPEYNYFAPPALVNAVDYLFSEWHYKPAGFVSYGGLSGGTRSVQSIKPLLTTVRMMPIPEAVNVPFFAQQLHDGAFTPTDGLSKSATGMLDELARWTTVLATMRQPAVPQPSRG